MAAALALVVLLAAPVSADPDPPAGAAARAAALRALLLRHPVPAQPADPLRRWLGAILDALNGYPERIEAAIAKVRETPLDAPDYTRVLRAATRAGLESKALVFTYSQPNLIAKSRSISDLPKNPAHIDWTGVTISGDN